MAESETRSGMAESKTRPGQTGQYWERGPSTGLGYCLGQYWYMDLGSPLARLGPYP